MGTLERSDRRLGRYAISVEEGRPAEDDQPELGAIIRHASAVMGFPTIPNVTTLYESFRTSVDKFADKKCLGWRTTQGPYEFYTYKEVLDKSKHLAGALVNAGFRPEGRCGIYGSNSPEWMLTSIALNRISGRLVPLYDTLGAATAQYIINNAEVSVVVAGADKLQEMAQIIRAVREHVKTVVYWGVADEETLADVQGAGVNVFPFDKFLEDGAATPTDPIPPKADDPACIVYTSGTTGNPKGVILTHANLISAIAGMHAFLRIIEEKITDDDCYFSFLPLAHVFGRVIEETVLTTGARIAYWQGSVKFLMSDARAARPTLFAAVPRVLERVVNETRATLNSKPIFLQRIFNWCLDKKMRRMYATGNCRASATCPERTFFRGVRGAFGGRVRFIISGGGPLPVSVQEFMQATMAAPIIQAVLQGGSAARVAPNVAVDALHASTASVKDLAKCTFIGYGLTETCAATFLSTGHPDYIGTVGPPLPATEFRLAAIPELGYTPAATPIRGEVCIRGPICFAGYHKNRALTQESFDEEGFFMTGDIGELTSNGGLKIIDRRANMIKLATGEYVAAEALEAQYQKSDIVDQIWVYGNSYEACMVAVVVPNQRILQGWAKKNLTGASKLTYEELLNVDQAKDYMVSVLMQTAKASKLKGHEVIKAVHLERDEWELGGEFLTPSFKLKRTHLQRFYQRELDALYQQIKLAEAARLAAKEEKKIGKDGKKSQVHVSANS